MSRVDQVAGMLATHARVSSIACLCGWRNPKRVVPFHQHHVAEILNAAGLIGAGVTITEPVLGLLESAIADMEHAAYTRGAAVALGTPDNPSMKRVYAAAQKAVKNVIEILARSGDESEAEQD